MFAWLRSLISAAVVVELHSARIRIRDVSGGATFEFEPVLSIDAAQRVVSVGRPISSSAVKTHAPFENPVAFAEDPRIAELILAYAYSKLGAVAWIKPAPRVVLLISNDHENGAQLLNDKTLVDLSASAGARTTLICRGTTLTDVEARRMLDGA
jgi:hypothetical protein